MIVNQELRIVRITENLGKGKFVSIDVFNEDIIGVKLSVKLRLNFSNMPIDKIIYVVITNSDLNNTRFIYIWRDAMSSSNKITTLDKQRKNLDEQFVEMYGKAVYNNLPK
jgi:hypothetical protein